VTPRVVGLCALLLAVAPAGRAEAATPTACQLVGGSQVSRIFAMPMRATSSAATGLYPGTTATSCTYTGGSVATRQSADLFVMTAASPEAAQHALSELRSVYAPAHGVGVLLGSKNRQVVMVHALTPSAQNHLAALVSEALRGL
jgi:hypothetical protein